ncbi:IS5 family transposase [Cyanobium sp. Morenito 9A2]|uniref:IS5 family transposase n=1 Tax=Cyanobium sp. Morenito 9A2 TaxID=2823718 RepID=UPI0020CE2A39|nr:IS5 family transposase [Cyanobium sp. Morenito 9A2]MCP9850944.1 IS5 family transposase [Cyanobium sp. Morenito 9A2]
MRGEQERSGSLFSYVSIEERIPASHPLRRIRKLADPALDRLNSSFCELYAPEGRPSVPPEQLLLASLLQAFYGIRSERLLLEQLHDNRLFRWFVDLSPDDPIWHPTTLTKNRQRLLNERVMGKFLEKLIGAPEVKTLLSNEHFSVDGTLLQAWASHASLKRIDGEEDPPPPPTGPGEGFGAPKPGKKRAEGDFRGIKISNDTHRSSTDPNALLALKSIAHSAQLSYRGHVLMDNRHDLIVDDRVTPANGTGERDAAQSMAADLAGAHQKTIGADKNYDTKGFVAEMRWIGVTAHVAQNTARSGGSAIDRRTTRHQGYAQSINARRGIEKVFGWIKAFGGLRQFNVRGTESVSAVSGLHRIAYNLIRLGNLLLAQPSPKE